MTDKLTRAALETGVLRRWKHHFPVPVDVARTMARRAVDEVVDALKYNPAWARSLGIGDGDG